MDINYSKPVNFEIKNYDEKAKIYNLGLENMMLAGSYPEQINLAGVQVKVGLGLGKLIKKSGNNNKISVGHDFRSYSEEIKEALIGGLIAAGIDVYDIGLTISPSAYFSQYFLNCDNVAMVTASHNPNGWTGIKMGNEKTLTFGPKLINQLKKIIEKKMKFPINPVLTLLITLMRYISDLISGYQFKRKIKAVVACGNGTAGIFAPGLIY